MTGRNEDDEAIHQFKTVTIMSTMYKSENNSDGPESFMNFEFFAVFMNAQVDTYVADRNDAKL